MDPRDFRLNSPEMTKLVKDVYLPAFETETWNNSGALSEAFGMAGIGGKINATSGKLDAYFKKGSVGSVGAFGDDLTFDTPDMKNTGDFAVIRTQGFQANAGINVIAAKRMSGPEAWESIFETQFDELTSNLKRQYSRMLYGDGSGVITTVEAFTAAAGTVPAIIKVADIRAFKIGDIISVAKAEVPATAFTKDAAGIEWDAAEQLEKSHNRWATHGTYNDTTAAELAKLITVKIDDIDYSTSEILVLPEDGTTPVAGLAKGNKIYYRRSVNSDIHGLDYIVRNTTSHGAGKSGYFGLGEDGKEAYGTAVGTRPRYMNSHITNVDNFLTEDAFMKHYEEVELIGQQPADLCITSRGTRRAIASVNQGATQSIVRLNRASTATAANDQRSLGYAGVDLRGEDIEVDRFAPSGSLWMLRVDSFDMANEQELTFDDYDGVVWKQTIVSNDKGSRAGRQMSYVANMYAYKELFNKNPRGLGKIVIKEPKIVLPTLDATKGQDVKELGQAQPAKTVATA